jgi:uncharacterized protein (DUF305 family)
MPADPGLEPAVSAPAAGDGPALTGAARPRWVRIFVAAGLTLGLLLLGAAGGLLLGLPGSTGSAVPAADSVDVGFAQDMTVHHQQAVEMASWERDHTTDPALKQLAADIEATQTSQIGRMQGWLELWGAGALPVGGHMKWMSDPTAMHDGHGMPMTPGGGVATMPGMASTADLTALRAASGPQLDVLFLQLMLRHHEGGAGMLSYAAERAELPQVRNLARQMLSSQTTESDYLRQLLAARGGTPLPQS